MPTGEPAGSIPNVGLFARAIKGKGGAGKAVCRLWLFEQLVGSAAMAGGVGHMLLDPGDLGLEGSDPFLELVDRQRAEILLQQQSQRVLGLAGKEVVLVHEWNR